MPTPSRHSNRLDTISIVKLSHLQYLEVVSYLLDRAQESGRETLVAPIALRSQWLLINLKGLNHLSLLSLLVQ